MGAVEGRLLSWDGCINVRDLGGLETRAGGRTRDHVVVRADNIRRLTPAGWQRAVTYGVHRVIDLRFPDEEPGEPELHETMDLVGIPLFDEHNPAAGHRHAEALRDATDVPAVFAEDYIRSLTTHRRQFGAVVAAVAEADGTVVVHCFAGKDRTGLVSALLLSLAGATDEAIVSDYAISGPNMKPLLGPWIDGADDEHDRRLRARMGEAPPEAMAAVVCWLDTQGGVRAYLGDAGVDERKLRTVETRLG